MSIDRDRKPAPTVVVRTPEENGGAPDDLAQIAERTLGDQNLAGVLLRINRGRVQQDGGVLTTPESLLPGWTMVLPPRARRAPGVRMLSFSRAPQRPSSGSAPEADSSATRVLTTVVRAQEENGGTPDDLAQIAQRTLGDQNRATEIFELNRGRVQDDESVMTAPDIIGAGWVLLLPPDARGPDVRRTPPDRVPQPSADVPSDDEDAVADGSTGEDGTGEGVPVTVVRTVQENDGAPDSLAQIAQRTLGDQNRAAEILELNTGRSQADGGVLTTPESLLPGWTLLLPSDAEGDDVATAPPPVDGQAPALDDAGTGSGSSGGNDDGDGNSDRPVVLAVVGGALLGLATALIVLRRRVRASTRSVSRAATRAWSRLLAPRRRRQSLQRRARLINAWREDPSSEADARIAVGALGDLSGRAPVAVLTTPQDVTVMGVHDPRLPPTWRPGHEAGAWTRELAGLRGGPQADAALVGIGGDETRRLFVDLAHCRGVLTIAGDTAVARDLASSIVEGFGSTPDVQAFALGVEPRPDLITVRDVALLEHQGLPPVATSTEPIGLVRSTLTRAALRAVVLAEPGVPEYLVADVAARCSVAGSGWLLVAVGEVPGAHWRWTAHPDGNLEAPVFTTPLVAHGTGSDASVTR